MTRAILTLAFVAAIWLPNAGLNAQSTAVEQLYGQGVHHYHANQIGEAMTAFSDAIRTGAQDPRLYYYRGLTHSSMGNTGAAEADFQMGAQIELTNRSGRNFAVGRALERIQGATRLQIEQARRSARLSVGPAVRIAPGKMPGNTVQAAPGKSIVIPDARAGSVAPRQTNFPDVSGVENPGTPFSATAPAAIKRTPSPPSVAAPLAKAAAPTESKMEEMTEAGADPFAGGASDVKEESDPFGGDEGDKSTEEADPFGGGEEADPFGDDEPMEEEDDPFGGEEAGEGESTDEEEDDDPFG